MSEEKSPEEKAKAAIFDAAKHMNSTIQPSDITYSEFKPTREAQRTMASLLGQEMMGVKRSEVDGIFITFKKPLGNGNMYALRTAISNATGTHAATNCKDFVNFCGNFAELAEIHNNLLFKQQIKSTTTSIEQARD